MNTQQLPSGIDSPAYVLEQDKFEKNLALIRSVAERSGANIILAFKAFAMWKTFNIVRSYVRESTASSLWEARMAYEEMGALAHTYSPVYKEEEMGELLRLSSHLTFNSLSQYHRFVDSRGNCPLLEKIDHPVSFGLRVNPGYSPVETELYNPCGAGTRFGIRREELGDHLPKGIEGLHVHALCEGRSQDLAHLLEAIETQFGNLLSQLKWINLGGGHLMTHKEYDVEHLIDTLLRFRERRPHLKVILEPGSAFAWQTGYLYSTVVDIVEDKGIKTAILDVSFTCHMPDCLEMPYKPTIRAAYQEAQPGKPTYRMGGCSCLAGDYIGDWSFDNPLKVGDRIIFEDMCHYTTVKTTMFNGVRHPSLYIKRPDDSYELLRCYTYEDYKSRMD